MMDQYHQTYFVSIVLSGIIKLVPEYLGSWDITLNVKINPTFNYFTRFTARQKIRVL